MATTTMMLRSVGTRCGYEKEEAWKWYVVREDSISGRSSVHVYIHTQTLNILCNTHPTCSYTPYPVYNLCSTLSKPLFKPRYPAPLAFP